MMKQKGFTLLELLVVVTILAILAASALVAYDGLSDSAIDSADANNIATLDSAIRTYKVAERVWPEQFDSLLAADGSAVVALDDSLQKILSRLTDDSSLVANIAEAFAENGVEEIQVIHAASNTAAILDGVTGGVNAAHNEASGASDEEELEDSTTFNFAVLANTLSGGATIQGHAGNINTNLKGGTVTGGDIFLNSINDSYETNESHLVVAFGFGGDAAASTTDSPAAIAAAPQSGAVTKDKYGRYIALFHVAEDEDRDNVIEASEVHEAPHFIGLITPQGKTLTTVLREQKGTN